jgi:hypothetical protein
MLSKFRVFALASLLSATTSLAFATSTEYCGDVAGVWNISDGNGTHTITVTNQTSGNVLSGTVHDQSSGCPDGVIQPTSRMNPLTGVATLNIKWPAQGTCSALSDTYTITIPNGTPGCWSGSVKYSGSTTYPVSLQFCQIPYASTGTNGENATTFVGWLTGYPGEGHFTATLKPPAYRNLAYFNYSGRTVTESFDEIQDGCIITMAMPTAGAWYIGPDPYPLGTNGLNGVDDIQGWGDTNYVNSVRHQLRQKYPCSHTHRQSMTIDCGSAPPPTGTSATYEQHTQTYTVGASQIEVIRNGVSSCNPLGTPCETFGTPAARFIRAELSPVLPVPSKRFNP